MGMVDSPTCHAEVCPTYITPLDTNTSALNRATIEQAKSFHTSMIIHAMFDPHF